MAAKTSLKRSEKGIGGCRLDSERGEQAISASHGTKSLTPKECQLLALFMSNPGRVLSRRLLMRKVWNTDYVDDTRILDVQICYLRRKIEQDPHNPERLRTVRGVGYCLVE